MGVGSVWAADADVTYDFTGSGWTASNGTLSNGTVSFTGAGSGSFKMNSGYFMLGKSGAYINFPTYSNAVEKIVVTGRNGASGSVVQNIYVGETAVSTATTGATGTNTYEIASANQAAGTQYTLKVTSSHNTQITKIEVFYVKSIAVTSVSLNKNATTLMVGDTETLTATVAPDNATNKNVSWSSSDATVASVENGTITAKKEGTATITVTTDDGGKTATCEVTVQPATAPMASLSTTVLAFGDVKVGADVIKTFTVTPSNLTGILTISCDNNKYTVSPTSIAQNVTAETEITVTARATDVNDNMTGTITISGGGITSQTVALSATPYVEATVSLVGANGTYTSENVEISDNTFTTKVGGTATVTATPNSGYAFTGWTAVGATPASSANATETFTITSSTATLTAAYKQADVYEKVTDASTLAEGDKLLIVYESGSKALANINSSGKIYDGADVTITDSKITDPSSSVAVLTLGGTSTGWTLQSSLDNKYLMATNSNELRQADAVSDNYEKWTITIEGGVASVTNVGYNTRTIKYNSGSPRFACYTSGLQSVALYRLKENLADATVTITPAEAFELNYGGTKVLTVTTTSDAEIVATSSDEAVATVAKTATNQYTVTAVNGTAEGTPATITFSTAKTATYKAANASVVVTVKDNRTVLDLSFAETSVNVNIDEHVAAPALSGNAGSGAVTYESSDVTIATVNASTGEVTGVAEGTATITATVAEVTGYKGGSASFTVNVIDPNRKGTAYNPYTVAQAIDAIDNDGDVTGVYVKGIVYEGGSSLSSGSMNYWISDDGTETDKFEIYKGKGIDGANFTATDDVQEGDVVVVRGNIVLYNSKTYEFSAGSQLVSLTRKAAPELAYATTAFETFPGDNEFEAPTLTNPHDLTVTYTSSDEDVAVVDDNTGEVILGDTEGSATITATFAGNETYKAGSASYTITLAKLENGLAYAVTSFEAREGKDFTAPTLTNPNGLTVTYASSDEDVAVVDDKTGEVVVGKAGEATITATFAGNTKFKAGSASYTLTVVAGKLDAQLALANATISMNAGTEKNITTLYTVASDGTVTYASDDEDVAKVVNGQLKAVAPGTATITVNVAEATDYEAATADLTVTVTVNPDVAAFDPAATGGYHLVTDASVLNAGDNLIIVSDKSNGSASAMGTQNSSNRGQVSVTIADGTVSDVNGAQVVTLEGETDAWYLNVGENLYLYASSNSSNQLKSAAKATVGDNGKAKITIDGNSVATIKFQGNNSRNLVRYNSSSNLFSCYASGQDDIYLYRSAAMTVGATGWRTLVASKNVKFPEGVSAYIVTESGDEATLKKVSAVAANVPVLVKAEAGNYPLSVAQAGECADASANLLRVSEQSTSEGYVLANKANGVGFYNWTGGWMGAGRVYLPKTNAARQFLGFNIDDDETTGIQTVQASGVMAPDSVVYDLMGRKVSNPVKGSLYIVNGRKVVVK